LTNDPVVNPNSDWIIVGFINSVFFDNDNGKPPPQPPGPSWEDRNFMGDPDYPTAVKVNPPVCDYDVPGRQPWAFTTDGTTGAERGCNMVRGRTSCSPDLVGSEEFMWGEPRDSKIVM